MRKIRRARMAEYITEIWDGKFIVKYRESNRVGIITEGRLTGNMAENC